MGSLVHGRNLSTSLAKDKKRELSKSKHTRRATTLIRNGYSSYKSIRVGNLMTVPSRDREVSLKGNNSSFRMARGPGVGRMTLDSLFPSKSL